MDYTNELKRKTVSAEEAVLCLQDGDYVHTYGTSVEPVCFLENLRLLKGRRKNITVVNFLGMTPFKYYTDESYRGVINNESMFFSRFCGESQKIGMISYIPNHLRNSGSDRFDYMDQRSLPINAYVISAGPPDRHGCFSAASVGMSNRALVARADKVILEINENLPRTFGDSFIHISEVDRVFWGDGKVRYLPEASADETDRAIGGYIAEIVEDESTIQLGIGSIPNAVAAALKDKKDLGVHTEMLGDGIVRLCEAGVVTNRKKTHYPDRIVTSFSFGTKAVYDFLDDNPLVLHLDIAKVNSPFEIAKNRRMVSVNTTLRIDLMGQCASEALGTLQISGTGGQTDTVTGAKMSPGGKSIIALRSTAEVKEEGSVKRRISKIASVHDAGTVISLLRADVDFVVTEYGIASLRGASTKERARSLIGIAHPD
ncbi:MAG: 4-hydroxybutyrate--acetyl-CoA CoA transferase, partial [Clostridiales Family XIII bacterium]|nr:4-hydroxybutyrate--acetyl-CoA CoA transferase [Clostridiales Family XIII bacterium]